jgi:hypothetical protein
MTPPQSNCASSAPAVLTGSTGWGMFSSSCPGTATQSTWAGEEATGLLPHCAEATTLYVATDRLAGMVALHLPDASVVQVTVPTVVPPLVMLKMI